MIESSTDLVTDWLEPLILVAICNISNLGGIALNSDENDKPPDSNGQSDGRVVQRDWVSALENAIETLVADSEDANSQLIEELEAARQAVETSRN